MIKFLIIIILAQIVQIAVFCYIAYINEKNYIEIRKIDKNNVGNAIKKQPDTKKCTSYNMIKKHYNNEIYREIERCKFKKG